jgi:predicted small lipoprotein YifL
MRSLSFLAATLLLAACGTRGPLVLPPPKPQAPAPQNQAAPADNSSKAPAGAAR